MRFHHKGQKGYTSRGALDGCLRTGALVLSVHRRRQSSVSRGCVQEVGAHAAGDGEIDSCWEAVLPPRNVHICWTAGGAAVGRASPWRFPLWLNIHDLFNHPVREIMLLAPGRIFIRLDRIREDEGK